MLRDLRQDNKVFTHVETKTHTEKLVLHKVSEALAIWSKFHDGAAENEEYRILLVTLGTQIRISNEYLNGAQR